MPIASAIMLSYAADQRATAKPARRTQMCCHLRYVRSFASHTLGSTLRGPSFFIHVVGSTTPAGSCALSRARLARPYLVREKAGKTESVP